MNPAGVISEAEKAIGSGLGPEGVSGVLPMLGSPGMPACLLEEGRIYSEHLPMADILGFTLEQRCLHFLRDALDRAPAALIYSKAASRDCTSSLSNGRKGSPGP